MSVTTVAVTVIRTASLPRWPSDLIRGARMLSPACLARPH